MTELNPKVLKKRLIELYSAFLKDPDNSGIKYSANKIYWDYSGAIEHFLDENTGNAVGQAVYITTGEMTIEKAKEILESLQK